MAIVSTVALEHSGIDPGVIASYKAAIDAAWAAFTSEYPNWETRAMTFWIGLKDPRDPKTVSVAVGMDAKYGRVEGVASEELQVGLLRHLRQRLGGT